MLLFAYGTFKQGFFNHGLVLGRPPLREAVVPGWEIAYYPEEPFEPDASSRREFNVNMGFPYIRRTERKGAEVVGELYDVTPAEFKRLDELMSVDDQEMLEGDLYKRVGIAFEGRPVQAYIGT